ncbi:MAG: amidohydrolase family protein [Bacteroidia bacterium]|jgi:imidazolonepropionase-like amidohydrolase
MVTAFRGGRVDAIRDQVKPEAQQQRVWVIRHVNIIPMTAENKVIENATVLIRGNHIISINGAVPDSAEIIDGKGKWLIPGLIDMHVHIPVDGHFNTTYPTRAAAIFTNTQHIMTPFVANGVTTVFELNARAGHIGQRNEILRGDVVGPRMALAGMIDGGEGDGRMANNPADGRQAVRMAKAEGYEFIKVYSKLNIETYQAIADEAFKQGMKMVGHIPNAFKGKIAEAFVPNLGLIAHAEELFKQTEGYDGQDPKQLAQLAKVNGTWLCPTLGIIHAAAEMGRSLDPLRSSLNLKYVHPLLQSKWLTANNYNKHATPESLTRLGRMKEFNDQLVKAFKEAGVPILAGTDAGSSGVIWGFSMHRELELLVNAGLTPEEALISATRLPATWLGLERFTGTVEAGKFADLVLLDANPLQEISNTQKIAGVFVNGKWLDKQQIETMLLDLTKQNAANKSKYDWNKRIEY